MDQISVKCPKCGEMFEVSQAISHEIEENAKRKYQKEIESQKQLMKDALVKKEREMIEKNQNDLKLLEAKSKKQAEENANLELSDLKQQLQQTDSKLQESRQHELELRKQKSALEDRERALEVELARRLEEERRRIREEVAKEADEKHRLKDAEKDKRLADALKQAEELQRKIEQGSQQAQGEVLELEFEELFKREFPFDVIEAVSKGVRGGDILQTVKTQSGRTCGKILWETKRTRNWSDSWIQKLKDDQRDAKADLAVLVSETLPAGFHHFRQLNGVWITDIPSALSLAVALRVVLVQVATAKEIENSKDDKKDLIYRYVTGPEFRNRVTAIIEGFRSMKEELDAEKRAIQRIWEKREKQIERIISNTAGMYGDLEGLAGSALPQIKILELPEKEAPSE